MRRVAIGTGKTPDVFSIVKDAGMLDLAARRSPRSPSAKTRASARAPRAKHVKLMIVAAYGKRN